MTESVTMANTFARPTLNRTAQPFQSPRWAKSLASQPVDSVHLAMLPTPITPFQLSGIPENVHLHIKRDDLTGMQMSGNKVRKLEFLMADALRKGCDCVITIGGIQSNHCRATATCARYLGMDCHLVLRNSERLADEDPGLVGNLLVERLQGAHIHQVSKADYVKHGSDALAAKLSAELQAQGKKPYIVPVGGSNSLGTWGYMMAMQEIIDQSPDTKFSHIVMACGSGATLAGMGLANHLTGYGAQVVGYGVCDDEAYFYDFIDDLYLGLGANVSAKDTVRCVQAKGSGYAMSRDEELEVVMKAAMETGIVLDPVYSGKALYGLLSDINSGEQEWDKSNVLFIHTGGLLGMYDKVNQLLPLVNRLDRTRRMPL